MTTSSRRSGPEDLGPRGQDLWGALGQTTGTQRGELALEICRAADRADLLHRMLTDALPRVVKVRVAEVTEDDDGKEVLLELRVDSLVVELRQQQTLLKQLMVAYNGLFEADDASPRPDTPSQPTTSTTDEFTARRRAREQRP